jgi:hypothetical protein
VHKHKKLNLPYNHTLFCSILSLSDKRNGTILGFIFNTDDAPTPPPVIKGAANQAQGMVAAVAIALIGSIIFL